MNAARKKREKREKFKRQFHSDEFVEFTKRRQCAVPGCACGLLSECAHNPSRGAGGTWEDISPLCKLHHADQHQMGVATFQKACGIRFEQTNAKHCRAWERREATC